jgi:hypothetical protein
MAIERVLKLNLELIRNGEIPEIQGNAEGPDFARNEVKARTEPFKNEKNAQNFFNDRIGSANKQFRGKNTEGSVTIDLADQATLNGNKLSTQKIKAFVDKAYEGSKA